MNTSPEQFKWYALRRKRLIEEARSQQRAIPSMFLPITGSIDLLGEVEARKKLCKLLNRAIDGTDFTLYEVLIEALECYLSHV